MPLITTANVNTTILDDIVANLAQIKLSGTANQRIAIGPAIASSGDGLFRLTLPELFTLPLSQLFTLQLDATYCTITFYSDAARQNAIGSENTNDNSTSFSTVQDKLFYTPPDSLLNAASGLSDTMNQPLYYWTAVYSDLTTFTGVYRNCDNLLFQSVIVSNKANPAFATNDSMAIIVPAGEKQTTLKLSGEHLITTSTWDIYLQLLIYNWSTLSEQQRISQRQQANNVIRNTLYLDRYRNGTCTLMNADLNGTYVGQITPIASDAALKGKVSVQTANWAIPTGY